MSTKIVVLGSNSFSGATFCRHMLKQGYEIVAISRSKEPIDALLPYKWLGERKLQFHQLDINHHLDEIERLLDINKISIVYNFAAQSMVGQSWQYPEHWFTTNTVSTIKLHNILKDKDYLDKYVHISTPEVYGSCQGYVKEDHLFKPSTPYAVSRAAADMSLQTFFDVHKFPVVTTRAANVYGPGQQLYRIIPKTIMSILNGMKLPLHGGGWSERSFIHMDDVSQATQLIGEKGEPGECFHIATENTISIRGLVELICQKMGVAFDSICEISDDRPGKDAVYLLDSSKLRDTLGWKDTVSLEKGVEQTIAWAIKQEKELSSQSMEYKHKQ